jgi:deoxyadenosine/deoxycytidine kinase
MHIAIAGNIGAGKTTLTSLLSEHYSWEAHFETVDENPYLDSFYADMQRWAFNLQIYFLQTRFQQIKRIKESKNIIIQDRTIYEDAYIFAANLHQMGLMSRRDFQNYQQIFELIESFLSPPDLLIYLRASVPTLLEQIKIRGRDYEANIREDYLSRLNERYEAWFSTYDRGNLLILESDDLDFNANSSDLEYVIGEIDKKLKGMKK